MVIGDVRWQDVFHVQEKRLRRQQREQARQKHLVPVKAQLRLGRGLILLPLAYRLRCLS